jgi:hypothetical protein
VGNFATRSCILAASGGKHASHGGRALIRIRSCRLPADAFLNRRSGGAYADCCVTEIARAVAQAEFVEAFHTTAVFRLGRLILQWLVARPSTDEAARQLAQGNRAAFAAWTVEARRSAGRSAGLGFFFTALLGFHKLYSRILLRSAAARLSRR